VLVETHDERPVGVPVLRLPARRRPGAVRHQQVLVAWRGMALRREPVHSPALARDDRRAAGDARTRVETHRRRSPTTAPGSNGRRSSPSTSTWR
jgi:hypothetical protein